MNDLDKTAQDFPDELKVIWDDLSSEMGAKRFQKHLDTLKRSVQNTQRLANSMQNHFQSVAPETVNPDARVDARKDLVSSIQLHSMTLNSLQSVFSGISATAKGLVQQVLDWIIKNIVGVLSNYAAQLNLVDWSVEVTDGLPLGLSFSVIITFK